MRAAFARTARKSTSAQRRALRGRPGGARASRRGAPGAGRWRAARHRRGAARCDARVRRQDAILAEAGLLASGLGEGVQGVGIQYQRAFRVQCQVKDQAPGRAVAAEPRPDDPDLDGGQLAQHGVIRGVADSARRHLLHRRGHDLGALGGQDGIDGLSDEEPDQAGARAGRAGGGEIGRPREPEAPREHHDRPEGALVGVARAVGQDHRFRRGQKDVRDVRHLEVGGRDGQPAVVGDAHLHAGAAVVAEEPHPRRAVRAGQDLDAPARKADAGAVEALDHGLLGRPAPGQPFGVGACVGELGGGVDLVQEAAAGPLDREGDPVHRYRINPNSLHSFIVRLVASWASPSGAARHLPHKWGSHLSISYSTVTLFARLRGWSTFSPSSTATWYANSCSMTVFRIAAETSSTSGISNTSVATPSNDLSPLVMSASTGALRATISWTLLTILSLVALAVQIAMTGNLSSSSAMGPCFSSPPVVASAWIYEISFSFRAPSRATG